MSFGRLLREPRKVHGFCAALEDDDQPAFSYLLPVGRASGDILAEIDDRVLSPSLGMRSKKVSKLLTYPGVCNRRFYRLEGEELSKVHSLNHHMTRGDRIEVL